MWEERLTARRKDSALSESLTHMQRHSLLCVKNMLLAFCGPSLVLDSLRGDVVLTEKMRCVSFLPRPFLFDL